MNVNYAYVKLDDDDDDDDADDGDDDANKMDMFSVI